MPLDVTEREMANVLSGRSSTIVRAHDKPVYKDGAEVPLGINGEIPVAIEIVKSSVSRLGQFAEGDARLAGFADINEFERNWRVGVYPGVKAFHRDDTKIVEYRFKVKWVEGRK